MAGTVADTVIGRSSVSSSFEFRGVRSNAVGGGEVIYGSGSAIPSTPIQQEGSFSHSFAASFSGGLVT